MEEMQSAAAAAYLGVTRQYLNQLVQDKKLPATRRGRYWWFKREDLDNRRAGEVSSNPADATATDELLTPGEAAKLLGIVRQRLTQLREDGVIPAERQGRLWMYRRTDIEKRLAEHPGPGRPAKTND